MQHGEKICPLAHQVAVNKITQFAPSWVGRPNANGTNQPSHISSRLANCGHGCETKSLCCYALHLQDPLPTNPASKGQLIPNPEIDLLPVSMPKRVKSWGDSVLFLRHTSIPPRALTWSMVSRSTSATSFGQAFAKTGLTQLRLEDNLLTEQIPQPVCLLKITRGTTLNADCEICPFNCCSNC